jgi:hypothetical protein
MGVEHPLLPPRLAVALAPGHIIDVPERLVPAILAAEPVVRHECLKWSRMHGTGGRVIVIDPVLVTRLLDGWPEIGQ